MDPSDVFIMIKKAWRHYERALELLDRKDWLANAAEEAWCATENAVKALVEELSHKSLDSFSTIAKELEAIERSYEELRRYGLRREFLDRLILLHGSCFCGGICEPRERIIELILETKNLIEKIEHILKNKF